MYKKYGKRILDFAFSLILLLVLLPLFLLLTGLLLISNSGEPFFFQTRPGLHEKLFKVIKFRTMNNSKDARGNLLADEMRLTPVGKFVRKTSLDEIPQLINVVKGDMSLIGPRPLLVEYVPLYNQQQRTRHHVRPGITGWAQVNGRNTISWKSKFEYDAWYVNNISFSLDVRIFFITIWKVVKSEGISGRGVATAQKFNGTN